MAKTAAERNKAARERKRAADPEAYRLWQRGRKQRQRNNRTEAQKMTDRQKNRERKARKKLAQRRGVENVMPEREEAPATAAAATPVFPNKQAESRSTNRVKQKMPRNEEQGIVVLANLYKAMPSSSKTNFKDLVEDKSIGPKSDRSGIGGRPPVLNELQRENLMEYIESPSISYTSPKKNDVVKVGIDGNKKPIYKPRHYLLYTYNELCALATKELEVKITYGTLWRFLKEKRWIKPQDDMPEYLCECEYCENIDLLFQGVGQTLGEVPRIFNPVEFPGTICCNPDDKKCICSTMGHENCGLGHPTIESLLMNLEDMPPEDELSFYQWKVESGKFYPTKILVKETGVATAKIVRSQLSYFLLHQFNFVRQLREYKFNKENLKQDEAIMHVDYAENYVNKQVNEPQSAYFGHDGFSLYTCQTYFRNQNGEREKRSFCIVTDEHKHDKFGAFTFNCEIIKALRAENSDISKIYFWSDGCAGQFRSRFCFALLGSYPKDLKVSWNFFESHHGKGPADGIGAVVKNSVYTDVRLRKVVISGPRHFARHANEKLNVTVVFWPSVAIERPELNSKAVKDTLKVRCFERMLGSDGFTVCFFKNSHFTRESEKMSSVYYRYDDHFHNEIENSGDDRDRSVSEHVDTNLVNLGGALVHPVSKLEELKRDDFVIAMYEGEWWVAKVLSVNRENNDVEVSFMHPPGPRTTFRWPPKPDILWVKLAGTPGNGLLGKIHPEHWPMPTQGDRAYSISNALAIEADMKACKLQS